MWLWFVSIRSVSLALTVVMAAGNATATNQDQYQTLVMKMANASVLLVQQAINVTAANTATTISHTTAAHVRLFFHRSSQILFKIIPDESCRNDLLDLIEIESLFTHYTVCFYTQLVTVLTHMVTATLRPASVSAHQTPEERNAKCVLRITGVMME